MRPPRPSRSRSSILHLVGGIKTVNLACPTRSAAIIDFQTTAVLRIIDDDSGISGTFTVTNTNDSGPGSLRQAILNANAAPGLNTIVFDIPASTAPLLDTPVAGFDPVNQTWTISVQSPLPTITDSIAIDGYTQAESGVPFRYPNAISSAVQNVNLTGVVTGGFFTLSTLAAARRNDRTDRLQSPPPSRSRLPSRPFRVWPATSL